MNPELYLKMSTTLNSQEYTQTALQNKSSSTENFQCEPEQAQIHTTMNMLQNESIDTDYPVNTACTNCSNNIALPEGNNDGSNVKYGIVAEMQTVAVNSAAISRVWMANETRMEPPCPTLYPDTVYPVEFTDVQFFTYMPDTIWYRDRVRGERDACHLENTEIIVDFSGENVSGGDCVVDIVEIVVSKTASSLGDDLLTAEMSLDGQEPELVQVTNSGTNVYRMNLRQSGIPENRRTLRGKHEIMIKLRQKTTGYRYLTVGCDRNKRPYAHVMGRVLPLPQPQEHYYCQTDQNKNVTELVDSTGSLRATWDYDAFGNCISQGGDKAAWNPIRYSSEYYDHELGLIYYNYRHYNPQDGRWISQDLIEEKGGYNLYEFLKNNINGYDYKGLSYEKTELDDYTIEEFSGDNSDETGKLEYDPEDLFWDCPGLPFGCCNLKMNGKVKFKILIRSDLNRYGMSDVRDKTINHELNHFKDFKEAINEHIERVKKYEGCQCRKCSEKVAYINASLKVMAALISLKNVELDLRDYEHGSKAWMSRNAQYPDLQRNYKDKQTELIRAAAKL